MSGQPGLSGQGSKGPGVMPLSSRADKKLAVDCGVRMSVRIPWIMTRYGIRAEMQITVSLDMRRAGERRGGSRRDGSEKYLQGAQRGQKLKSPGIPSDLGRAVAKGN